MGAMVGLCRVRRGYRGGMQALRGEYVRFAWGLGLQETTYRSLVEN